MLAALRSPAPSAPTALSSFQESAPVDFSVRMKPEDAFLANRANQSFNKAMGKPADPASSTAQVSQDQFLRLLTVQMSKQDPMNPMQNHEMMAQMAQFTALEQMVKMNKGVEGLSLALGRMGAQELLGRNITWTAEDGAVKNAVVDRVGYEENGAAVVFAGEAKVRMEAITQVQAAPNPFSLNR